MPYSLMTDEQIIGLLAKLPEMLSLPGVALVMPELTGLTKDEVALVVTVYPRSGQQIAKLPLAVAGLPVVVKVEELFTGRVLEVIDPRENGGAWPSTTHNS